MKKTLFPIAMALLAILAWLAWPASPKSHAQVGQSLGQAQPQAASSPPGGGQPAGELTERPGRFYEGDDKIELAILFWYGCPACRASDQATEDFAMAQAGDVRAERLPMFFPGDPGDHYVDESQAHGRLFLALEALGAEPSARQAAFGAAQQADSPGHRDYGLLDREAQKSFAESQGLDGDAFLEALGSQPVFDKEARIKDFIARAGLMGVPAAVVNGRYVVYYSHGPAFLGQVEELIESERNRLAPGAPKD
jgi:thiol:disulfide interchange protein DsbA